MSEAKFTPGEWETVGASRIWSPGRDDGGAIAIIAEPNCENSSDFKEVWIFSKRWDEAMANAHLIAACPRMFDYIAGRAALGDSEAREIINAIP